MKYVDYFRSFEIFGFGWDDTISFLLYITAGYIYNKIAKYLSNLFLLSYFITSVKSRQILLYILLFLYMIEIIAEILDIHNCSIVCIVVCYYMMLMADGWVYYLYCKKMDIWLKYKSNKVWMRYINKLQIKPEKYIIILSVGFSLMWLWAASLPQIVCIIL